MTACPCAQELVAARARERLQAEAFSDEQIQKVFESVPVATHNQRGLGTLHIGCPEECDTEIEAAALLEIVEGSMSSEIYELMKRVDEVEVVEKAHRRPRFVEDCVREMVAAAVERFPGLPDGAFVSARQENLETIHQHNVIAERYGLMGEVRGEIQTQLPAAHQTTLDEWLGGRGLEGRSSRLDGAIGSLRQIPSQVHSSFRWHVLDLFPAPSGIMSLKKDLKRISRQPNGKDGGSSWSDPVITSSMLLMARTSSRQAHAEQAKRVAQSDQPDAPPWVQVEGPLTMEYQLTITLPS